MDRVDQQSCNNKHTFKNLSLEVDVLLEAEILHLALGREVDLSRHRLALEDLLRHACCTDVSGGKINKSAEWTFVLDVWLGPEGVRWCFIH